MLVREEPGSNRKFFTAFNQLAYQDVISYLILGLLANKKQDQINMEYVAPICTGYDLSPARKSSAVQGCERPGTELEYNLIALFP